MSLGDTLPVLMRPYGAGSGGIQTVTVDNHLLDLHVAVRAADDALAAARAAFKAHILDRDLEAAFCAASNVADDALRAYDTYLRRLVRAA